MDENEIKKRLFVNDDNEDTEAPVNTFSAGNVIIFPDFKKLKTKWKKCVSNYQCFCLSVMNFNFSSAKILKQKFDIV